MNALVVEAPSSNSNWEFFLYGGGKDEHYGNYESMGYDTRVQGETIGLGPSADGTIRALILTKSGRTIYVRDETAVTFDTQEDESIQNIQSWTNDEYPLWPNVTIGEPYGQLSSDNLDVVVQVIRHIGKVSDPNADNVISKPIRSDFDPFQTTDEQLVGSITGNQIDDFFESGPFVLPAAPDSDPRILFRDPNRLSTLGRIAAAAYVSATDKLTRIGNYFIDPTQDKNRRVLIMAAAFGGFAVAACGIAFAASRGIDVTSHSQHLDKLHNALQFSQHQNPPQHPDTSRVSQTEVSINLPKKQSPWTWARKLLVKAGFRHPDNALIEKVDNEIVKDSRISFAGARHLRVGSRLFGPKNL